MKSEHIGELAKALSIAQGEMDAAKKDSTNPFFKNKYADLSSVIEAIKEPLRKNGLSYTQYCEHEGDQIFLTTELIHSSGQWILGKLKLILSKQDMQGLGGAITYARRYSLSAMVGITQDDDDGNTAVNHPQIGQSPNTPSPIKPQAPWKPTIQDQEHLSSLVKRSMLPASAITATIRREFKKEKSSDLSEIEYDRLCHLVETIVIDHENKQVK